MMNEIWKYRKATAEALTVKIEQSRRNRKVLILFDGTRLYIEDWQPDKDANQREIVEGWILKQDLSIRIDKGHPGCSVTIYGVSLYGKPIKAENISGSMAFMQTFMKYINN